MSDHPNYFDPEGGELGTCTNCGQEGMLKPYPGSPRDCVCPTCRHADSVGTGAFLLFMFVGIPIFCVLALVFGWFA